MAMPTEPNQVLYDQLAHLDGEISKAEEQMRNTAPLSEYRRLIELLNRLRTERNEIQAKLESAT